ncbi:uncharacterized protein PG986_000671 [Apiospora aurea]|uniref:Uncharacterized protein n=1 Tax=Apiospora aurea TaxID=335848 RepID=A0ABR1QUP6_9PEZI
MKPITTATTILALTAKAVLAQENNKTWSDKCKVLQFANAVSDSAMLKVACDDGPACVQLDLSQCLGIKDNKLVGLENGKFSSDVEECIMSPRTGMLKCKKKGGEVLAVETDSLIEPDNGGIKCFGHASVPCTSEL